MRVNAWLLQRTNSEGLTWPEWANAARLTPRGDDHFYRSARSWVLARQLYPKPFQAWREGEDPTEWAASR